MVALYKVRALVRTGTMMERASKSGTIGICFERDTREGSLKKQLKPRHSIISSRL